MSQEFSEVLNDLIDYFLLGDIRLLKRYKTENNLPDDLASEFTTTDSGDNAVLQGIVIPLAGIENHPYTIIFNVSDETPELFLHRRSVSPLTGPHPEPSGNYVENNSFTEGNQKGGIFYTPSHTDAPIHGRFPT